MKKVARNIILLVTVLILALSLAACSGCNVVSVNPGGNGTGGGTIVDPSGVSKNLGKTYDVESVTFHKSTDGAALSLEDAIDKVFESVVVVKTDLSGGTGWGSGILLDMDVVYQDASVNRNDFVYILTCHHVIEDGLKVTVYLPKYDELLGTYEYETYAFSGTLVGGGAFAPFILTVDRLGWVCYLLDLTNNSYGLSESELVKAQINDGDLTVGQDVFAVGNPTGYLPGTVTKGIVSYINREVSVEDIGTMTLIQVDAAINHGNSGGGLFNLAGELIGVVNSGADDYQGLNFAIPIFGANGAEAVAESLVMTSSDDNYGYMQGRWKFGATFSVASDRYGSYVQISAITEGGTLAKAGAKNGDILVSLSGEKNGKSYQLDNITSLSEFSEFYDGLQRVFTAGDTLTMVVQRNFSSVTLKLTLEQYIYNSL